MGGAHMAGTGWPDAWVHQQGKFFWVGVHPCVALARNPVSKGRSSMLNKFLLAGLGSLTIAASASAHDFWVEVDRVEDGGEQCVNLTTQVGHGADRSAWPMHAPRILSLHRHDGEGSESLLDLIGEDSADGEVSACNIGEGTQLFVVQSFRAFIELEAERFNSYIEEEGVRPLIRHRLENGLQDEPGVELYSRIGKSVLTGADDGAFVTEPLGLLLEVTPMRAPQDLAPGETLEVSVMYRERPAAGATIHITALHDDTVEAGPLAVDEEGRAQFEIPEAGRWMLHVVWGEAGENLIADADYATVFSSLTFNVEAAEEDETAG